MCGVRTRVCICVHVHVEHWLRGWTTIFRSNVLAVNEKELASQNHTRQLLSSIHRKRVWWIRQLGISADNREAILTVATIPSSSTFQPSNLMNPPCKQYEYTET
jgi:hypothetical protein